MKIIVSHDVDHIGGWCHWWKDLYWEKFLIKSLLYLVAGKIGFKMFCRRLMYVFSRRIENIDELMAFDREHGIPSTFFVGVNNALGMSYSLRAAKEMAKRIYATGFDVGVHGVAFEEESKIAEEFEKFKQFGIVDTFGVRNHYLRGRNDCRMHECQAKVGYSFDSTDYGLAAPYKVGDLWEFPLSIMDTYILRECGNNMEVVKKATLDMLNEAEEKKLPYFTILFHNPSSISPDYMCWYSWIVAHLRANNYLFVSFRDAIKKLS